MDNDHNGRALGDLFTDLAHQTQELVSLELELAKCEMSEKAEQAARGAKSLAVGSGVLYAGILCLAAALVLGVWALLRLGLPTGVAAWLAPLIVGAAVSAIGYGMVRSGAERVKPAGLLPRETAETLKENKEWLKQEFRGTTAR